MRKVSSTIETLSNMGGYLSAIVLLLMIPLIMYEVFMRYVLNNAPGIADEISAYMYIAVIFFGLAYSWKEKSHIRIEFIVNRLPARAARWIRLVMLFVALAFVVNASKATWDFALGSAARGLRSPTQLRIPLQWPELPLAIGLSLLSLQLIIEIVRAIKNVRSAIEEQAA